MSGQRNLLFVVMSSALAGLITLALALPRVELWPAMVALAAVFVAEMFASGLRDEVRASLTNIVVLVAVIIGEGPELAVVATLGALPVFVIRAADMRLLRTSFYTGQFILAAAAGGLTYSGMVALWGADFPEWQALLSVLMAALVFSLVNHLLVAGVVTVSSADRYLSTIRTMVPSLVMQVPYVGIAVLAAVVLERASVWALVLMGVPAVIARFGLLAFQRLDESYDSMVRSFVNAIEIKDLYTRGHSERVAQLSVLVAEELGISYEERRLTRYAALLHDVGKIGVPLCIINKPGPLDDAEFEEIKKHPTIGADILHDIDFLAPAIDIVRYHHERLDGKGYPYGVSDAQLSDIVRIVTAVDAFDAMTSTRSYRRALTVEAALAELRRCAGRQFDPRMVEALAVVVVRVGWEPTIEFASEAELHGHQIPIGTAQERLAAESTSPDRSW
jgi:putative nucleotidyltransferase with HDIG domain